MPKRPRQTPHQRDLSVQDVRDYSTPQGAAMANEEMRRLALGVKDLKDEINGRLGDVEGKLKQIGGGAPGTPVVSFLSVWNKTNAGGTDVGVTEVSVIEFDDGGQQTLAVPVNFFVQELQPGVAVVRAYTPDFSVGVRHANTAYDNVRWIEFFNTNTVQFVVTRPNNGIVRIRAKSPLQIFRNGDSIGDDETTALDFDNATNSKPAGYTKRVWFDAFDDGNGLRRIEAWYEDTTGAGSYSYFIGANGESPGEEITNAELVSLNEGDATVAIVRSGSTFTFSSPLQIREDGVDVGDSATVVLDFDNAVAVKPGTYTKRIWFDVQDDGSGERKILGWYEDDAGAGAYSYFIGANGESPGEEVTNAELVLLNEGNPTVEITRSGSTFTFVSPLQIREDGVDVGDNATVVLDFDNAVAVKPGTYTKRIWFDVEDNGGGERRVLGWYEDDAGAGAYSFFVGANGEAPGEEVTNAELVLLNEGNATVGITRVGSTFTFVSPLQIREDGVDVGDDATVVIDFDNAVAVKPSAYTKRIWFDVQDDGGGERRILGWYEDDAGAGAYSFFVGANGESPGEEITNAELVLLNEGNATVVITRVGSTFTFSSPLQVREDGVDVGDNATVVLDFDNAVAVKPGTYTKRIWFDVQDDGGGERRILGWYEDDAGAGAYSFFVGVNGEAPGEEVTNAELVLFNEADATVEINRTGSTILLSSPLQIRKDGTDIGDRATIVVDYDNATVGKPGTYTKRVWFDVFDDGGGTRRVLGWYEDDAGATYTFSVEAEDTPGASVVASGATIRFTHGRGILITRTNDDIHIDFDRVDPPWGNVERRFKSGVLDFSNAANDYITGGAKPAHLYGVRQYVDIVHNWNLSAQHDYHLELVDYNLNDDGVTIDQYRDGTAPVNGDPAIAAVTKVKFRNIPHWSAIDRNTIRVWATMTLGRPTNMKFRYTLQEL